MLCLRNSSVVKIYIIRPKTGLIMYILTTLEFPKHNLDFHLLTTSVNAKILLLIYPYTTDSSCCAVKSKHCTQCHTPPLCKLNTTDSSCCESNHNVAQHHITPRSSVSSENSSSDSSKSDDFSLRISLKTFDFVFHVSAVHQRFSISICISTLLKQQTTFIVIA